MKKILQIFVIWENGRPLENKIMQDIATKYDILQTFTISWPAAEFAQNLSRFYGKKIPAGCKKEKVHKDWSGTAIQPLLCFDGNKKQ